MPVIHERLAFSGTFRHHCDKCLQIGSDSRFDYYICHGDHGPMPGIWLIARWSSHPMDYTACRNGCAYNEELEKCQRLARYM